MLTRRHSSFVLPVVLSLMVGCGHYPAPIRSARDVDHASSSESMIVIGGLPIEDWPKLQKFGRLEHFNIAKEMAPQISDAHIAVLSRMKFPRLQQISLAHCSKVTNEAIRALTNFPSIRGLQLIDTSISDTGMQTLATAFPNLKGVNVEGCKLLSERGFLEITNSSTITDVSLSLDPLNQDKAENIISTVSKVKSWTISDPLHELREASLRQLGQARKITIQIADAGNSVRSITKAEDSSTNENVSRR